MGFTKGLKVWQSLMANSSWGVAYSFWMGAFMVLNMLWSIEETLN